ncbi:MAG: hypothetical protein GXO35_07600 [Gammaproteobacteria bacterium]|nr:hypothetical protein [Gammaproteobacteria bacterium]
MSQKKLRVRSIPRHFRRAGLSFSQTEVTLNAKDLSEEQIIALNSEPNLVVTKVIEKGAPLFLVGQNTVVQQQSDSETDTPDISAADLVEHIALLNIDIAGNWTGDGKPQVKALEGAAGVYVTAALRDEAFDLYVAQQAELLDQNTDSSNESKDDNSGSES